MLGMEQQMTGGKNVRHPYVVIIQAEIISLPL